MLIQRYGVKDCGKADTWKKKRSAVNKKHDLSYRACHIVARVRPSLCLCRYETLRKSRKTAYYPTRGYDSIDPTTGKHVLDFSQIRVLWIRELYLLYPPKHLEGETRISSTRCVETCLAKPVKQLSRVVNSVDVVLPACGLNLRANTIYEQIQHTHTLGSRSRPQLFFLQTRLVSRFCFFGKAITVRT